MTARQLSPSNHFARIDVLRAVAILLVFFHHYWLAVLDLSGGKWSVPPWKGLLFFPGSIGFLGVKLFFVISGFCIHLSWLKWRRNSPAGPLPVRRFLPGYLWRRFWRIYPPYLGALLVFFLIQYPEPWSGESLRQLSVHALMLQNLSRQFFQNINPSFWSLAVEWQLYLVYPLFLVVALAWRIEAAFIAATGVAFAMRLAGLKWGGNYFVLHSAFSHWLEWVIGALVADFFLSGRKVFRWHPVVVPVLIFLTGYVHLRDGLSVSRYLVPTVAFAALLEWYLHARRPLALAERILVPVGLCSYSLYLLHQPCIAPVLRAMRAWMDVAPPAVIWVVIPAGLFVPILALSWLCYRWVELGSIETGRRLWERRTAFVSTKPACD